MRVCHVRTLTLGMSDTDHNSAGRTSNHIPSSSSLAHNMCPVHALRIPSQTLRMMGTYDTDHDNAERTGNHIPSFCPGGAVWYHPDVVLTSAATARRTQLF